MIKEVADKDLKRAIDPVNAVNSSPYAVKAYEQLSFVKTGEQQEKDGIIFIPMRRPLDML